MKQTEVDKPHFGQPKVQYFEDMQSNGVLQLCGFGGLHDTVT